MTYEIVPANDDLKPDLYVEVSRAPRHVALSVSLALLYAVVAAYLFELGDGGHYNGWLVLVGWVSVIMAWRAWAERHRPWRNPLASFTGGVGILALSALSLLWRLVGLAVILFLALGALTLVEWSLSRGG